MNDIKIRENPLDDGRPVREGNICITVTLPRAKFEKFDAMMDSDAWEKAQALRQANLAQCCKSLEVALDWALHHDCSGAGVFARLLASLYNGERVQVNMWRLCGVLDSGNFEHAMNVIRLCGETGREPHTFFVNGGEIFEKMISDWGLEKKRRARK